MHGASEETCREVVRFVQKMEVGSRGYWGGKSE